MNPGGDRLSDARYGMAHGEMALDTRRAALGREDTIDWKNIFHHAPT